MAMALSEAESEQGIAVLQRLWFDMARTAGVAEDVSNLFMACDGWEVREMGFTAVDGFYLDMNAFMHHETGRGDLPDLPEWIAPLGVTVEAAATTLRGIFQAALPRMRELQRLWTPPDIP
jgi:hypothetical protein